MLKKMKWRFIGAAMGAFGLVIILLAVVIDAVCCGYIMDQQDKTLEGIFRSMENRQKTQEEDGDEEDGDGQDDAFPEFKHPGAYKPEFEHTTRFFLVEYDQEGDIEKISHRFMASVTDEDIRILAENVLSKEKETGNYEYYRYRLYETDTGRTLIFLDISREKEFIRILFWSSAVLALMSFLLVFGLVFLLSGRAIRPYVRNMEKQKQFITDAGHELKTPLTSISASADVLEMTLGEDEWLENIRKQTGRLSKLIKSMITLSKLDEEMLPEKEIFSLSEAVWETVEPFITLAGLRGIHYTQNIEEALEMRGDQSQIQQMLSILLDNAVKYTDEGGSIDVMAFRDHDRMKIRIENTCILPPDIEPERLFDRFYRPEHSRSAETGGFGLGLSIARTIARVHGGDITVKIPADNRICFMVVL